MALSFLGHYNSVISTSQGFLREVAGGPTFWHDFAPRGDIELAPVLCEWAAGMKGTSRRGMDGGRNFAAQHNAVDFRGGIGRGNR